MAQVKVLNDVSLPRGARVILNDGTFFTVAKKKDGKILVITMSSSDAASFDFLDEDLWVCFNKYEINTFAKMLK